jgi:hypothetical protein
MNRFASVLVSLLVAGNFGDLLAAGAGQVIAGRASAGTFGPSSLNGSFGSKNEPARAGGRGVEGGAKTDAVGEGVNDQG